MYVDGGVIHSLLYTFLVVCVCPRLFGYLLGRELPFPLSLDFCVFPYEEEEEEGTNQQNKRKYSWRRWDKCCGDVPRYPLDPVHSLRRMEKS